MRNGALAEYVQPADVQFTMVDSSGMPIAAHLSFQSQCNADGGMQLLYMVYHAETAECASDLYLNMSACGVSILR